jgi:uncharacterized caspase-like protein
MHSTQTPTRDLARRQLLAAGAAGALLPTGQANAAVLRNAIVIGNAAYQRSPLRNAVADARLVSGGLRGIGFDVDHHEDLPLAAMLNALARWLARASGAEVRLLYFAGHGAQYRGQNFLLPVDAQPREEADLLRVSVNASELIDRLARQTHGVNVVVLDACRGGLPPLEPPRGRPPSRDLQFGSAAATSGLAAEVSPKGTLIAYAAAPGASAFDGSGANGAYAHHLTNEMQVAGAPIESVFKRVRTAVARDTGNRQVPWETSSLVGDFCLRWTADGQCGNAQGGGIDLGRLR